MVRRFIFIGLFAALSLGWAEEGMYPMSELHRIDFRAKGFDLSAADIFNPDGVSLTDAIVSLGGCTASFVSADGLMLTNHHCAFSALQRASTPEHDYLKYGFLDASPGQEVPAPGYTVRIIDSYRDVSTDVKNAEDVESDFAARNRAKEKRIKAIVAEAEKAAPGKRAEVAEMFTGRTWVLFLYSYLRDVRLVYAPPIGIGNFGGEEDNWTWPRHTGDFSFMRAYVAPDGSPADYAAQNVPYHPKKFFHIAAAGVNEGDPVAILGFPGRTFRHNTSHYLAFEERVRMPWIVDWYGFQIASMEEMGRTDRTVELKLAGQIKGLANVYKNYQGKIQGMKRLDLVGRKIKEEEGLQAFIEADAERNRQYGGVLSGIARLYQEMEIQAPRELLMDQFLRSSTLLNVAYTLYQSSVEMPKLDIERDGGFMERNLSRTKEGVKLALDNFYEPSDRLFLKTMLMKWAALPAGEQPSAVQKIVSVQDREKAIDRFLDRAFKNTRLRRADWVMSYWGCKWDELARAKDPILQLAKDLYPDYQALRERRRKLSGELESLSAQLIQVKQLYQGHDFMPDANSTLRFTFGRVNGYDPADAIHHNPVSTLRGVVEKNTGTEPYNAPERLLDLYRQGELGAYVHPTLGSVPVDILYDTDTTGGNSGSPVFNSHGELVGLNFDRAFTATINDYAWSPDYSRSIGVDIRYVLWILDRYSGAHNLLAEMGIQ